MRTVRTPPVLLKLGVDTFGTDVWAFGHVISLLFNKKNKYESWAVTTVWQPLMKLVAECEAAAAQSTATQSTMCDVVTRIKGLASEFERLRSKCTSSHEMEET